MNARPADLEVRDCVDRNIRLIDPPRTTPAPSAVACDACGITLVGVVSVVDHYQYEHPTR